MITVDTVGSNTEVTVTFSAPTAKMLFFLETLAQGLHDGGRGDQDKTWEELTNQEKLGIIEQFTKSSWRGRAASYSRKVVSRDAVEALDETQFEI